MRMDFGWLGRSMDGLVAAALLSAMSGASAQEPPPAGADAGAFDMLVLPVRSDPGLDMWNHVPSEVGPTFRTVSSICPNEQIMVLAFFKNLGDDGHGQGHATLEFTEEGPDGKIGLHQANVPAWDGPVPPANVIALSRSTMGISFDDKEPLGPMHFRLSARDDVRGVTVEKSFDLSLVPWSYGDKPASSEDFDAWFPAYHDAPHPAEAVRAFLEYASFEDVAHHDWNYATVGFFCSIFRDQPWLLDHLLASARTADEDRRAKTAILLHLLGEDDRLGELYSDPDGLAKTRGLLADVTLPDPYGPLASPAQLDLLWGEFFASGRYRPVRQIVRALDLMDSADPTDVYKASAKTEADKAALLRALAVRSAVWSLRSNLEQHPLVFQFGVWMLTHEELAPRERDVLRATLKVVQDEQKAQPAGEGPR